MTGADWLIVAVILLSSLLAAEQGFFHEIFLLAGALLGYLLAIWRYHWAANWFAAYCSAAWMADVAGFLTIFFVCLLLASIAGRICRWLFHKAGLAWFDRLLGAALGLVLGVAMVTVVVSGIAAFSPGSRTLARSRLSGYFVVLGRGASWLGPSALRTKLRANAEKLEEIAAPEAGAGTAARQK